MMTRAEMMYSSSVSDATSRRWRQGWKSEELKVPGVKVC